MQDDEFENDFSGEKQLVERPNKEQLKRQTQALKSLVVQLIDLPPNQLEGITINDDIRAQLVAARKMERSALNRQIKYIVGMFREVDSATIERELYLLAQPHKRAVENFHQVEMWRDELLKGSDELMNELVNQHAADRQHLRQLVRNAIKERDADKPPKSARMLFQYLKALYASE